MDSCSRGTAGWSEERSNLCRRVLEDLIHACGDKPIDSYGRSDGRNFLGLLRRLPANLGKVQARLGVASRDLERLAAAAEQPGLPPQDDATVNKKVGILKQCFKWIMTHYDECQRSPVDGMGVKVQRSARDQKEPFTAEQLNQLFRAPVYTGCQSELHWKIPGDTVLRASPKFWVPLIGLYTGMRLGEICQLARSHVRVHEAIHYFALGKELRLKNDASIRSVPIHRDLIAFGLLEFVAMWTTASVLRICHNTAQVVCRMVSASISPAFSSRLASRPTAWTSIRCAITSSLRQMLPAWNFLPASDW